jgi:hypothetical protein
VPTSCGGHIKGALVAHLEEEQRETDTEQKLRRRTEPHLCDFVVVFILLPSKVVFA